LFFSLAVEKEMVSNETEKTIIGNKNFIFPIYDDPQALDCHIKDNNLLLTLHSRYLFYQTVYEQKRESHNFFTGGHKFYPGP